MFGRRLFWFCLFIGLCCSVKESVGESLVYRVDIKDEIGPGIWRTTRKAFEEAERMKADVILIDMNTYGGLVGYADSLRTLILNSERPVWVFIDNNAASAGALISIACDKIYMREGANIGAATVVNQAGAAMPDKYQSYMRAMMRSTAQAQGKDTIIRGKDTLYVWKRDPLIAEAMVDERVYIPEVSDSGKVLTFTSHEAMQHGYCDGIAESLEDIAAQEKLENYRQSGYQPDLMDRVIGFLIHPVVRGLLIMLIIGGIYFELQTPGIGFPLAAAFAGCVLYFAPLYLEGLAAYWEIILFIAGFVLLMLEIFVIPGFGVAGVTGIICMLGALVLAGVDQSLFGFWKDLTEAVLCSLAVVVTAAVVALGGSMWLGHKIFGSRRWALALQAEHRVEEGYVGVDMAVGKLVGRTGMTVTDLRPAGKVEVEGDWYDAIADNGEFILKNVPVKVLKYQAGQLYVVKI